MSFQMAPNEFGLKFRFDKKFGNVHTQNLKPSWKQTFDLMPMVLRYIPYYFKQEGPVLMDYFSMQNSKNIYGCPIGGIGSGSIGRGFAGEFCRYALTPGIYEYNTVNQNQFIVNIKDKHNKTTFQSLLSTFSHSKYSNLDASKCFYTALYPRAWSEFDLSEYGIKLICRQISPFIPHNYKDSSLPCAIFVWEVLNVSDEERRVSITFVMKNGTGNKKDSAGNPKAEVFSSKNVEGSKIIQNIGKMPCSYVIGTKKSKECSISKISNIDPCWISKSKSALWDDLNENGILTEKSEDKKLQDGKDVCMAVSKQIILEGNKAGKIEIGFVWDAPQVKFPKSEKTYNKYYTKYFDSGIQILDYAIENYPTWENLIAEWQNEVLDDKKLPEWFKNAVFNEMYFIADGGSLWLKTDGEFSADDPREMYGRFLYLEGHEYRMYNTYDVHFYASFALMSLFPNLEISLQYDFRDSIIKEDVELRTMLYDGKICKRKIKYATPHDFGEPTVAPYEKVNAYPIHDVSEWKDLNPKFILQIYRDFYMLRENERNEKQNKMEALDPDKIKTSGTVNSIQFLKDFYPVMKLVMEKTLTFDEDNDGLIENSNSPDQTYDTWVMSGPSSYCAGLFLASLHVFSEIADILEDKNSSEFYRNILEKGKTSFEEKLWNGSYYRFDASESKTIMSDQLCGHWFLRNSGFCYEVFPEQNVKSALKVIYENNVKKFCDGCKGAVNGWIPDKGVDKSSMQSEEVWIGVNYGLASLMIHEGLISEAFDFVGKLYKTMTEDIGLAFETPEALYEKKIYRSIGYCRCLSMWSIYLAYKKSVKSIPA